MSLPRLDKQELEERKRNIDAWVRWRLARGLDLFASETRPACGTMFELVAPFEPGLGPKMHAGCEETSALRHATVRERGLSSVLPLEGRWVLFIPDAALFCQLAHDPGFIDEAAGPGWDLWADVVEVDAWDGPLLLSWVPKPLVSRIDEGTKLCSAGEMSWADSPEMARGGIAGCLVSMGLMRWADDQD